VIKKNELDIISLADKLSAYGTDILQFRFQSLTDQEAIATAIKLAKVIHKRKKIFIVNNRADIAYLSNADGIHLGKNDISPNQVRKILGKKSIIGKTVHSLAELKCFQNQKIDYISIGPTFKTKTKPALKPLKKSQFRKILRYTKKSVFAIGGINMYNIGPLLELGITNVCMCQALILSKNLKSTVKEFKQCLKKVS